MIDRRIKEQLRIDPERVEVNADVLEEAGDLASVRTEARAAARRYELGARWLRWTNKDLAKEYLRRASQAYRRGRSFGRALRCATRAGR